PTFVTCAEKNIQLHGGIGFTWEHDAHVILKRAVSLAAVFGPIGDIEADVTRLTEAGVVGAHAVELPPEADRYRTEVRSSSRGTGRCPPTSSSARSSTPGTRSRTGRRRGDAPRARSSSS